MSTWTEQTKNNAVWADQNKDRVLVGITFNESGILFNSNVRFGGTATPVWAGQTKN